MLQQEDKEGWRIGEVGIGGARGNGSGGVRAGIQRRGERRGALGVKRKTIEDRLWVALGRERIITEGRWDKEG